MLVTWAEKRRKNLPKEDIKYGFGQKKVIKSGANAENKQIISAQMQIC